MAKESKYLHQALVEVDENGVIVGLKVDLGEAEIHADVIDVDMEALTGEGENAKSLADVVSAMAPVKKATASTSESSTSVGASASATVIPANANRVQATITNPSDTAVLWLSLGGTAEIGKGIPIYPHEHYDESVFTGAIKGIMSSGTVSVPWAEL